MLTDRDVCIAEILDLLWRRANDWAEKKARTDREWHAAIAAKQAKEQECLELARIIRETYCKG